MRSSTLRSLAFLQWLASQAEAEEQVGPHASIHVLGQQLMSLRLNSAPPPLGAALLSTIGSDEAAGGGADVEGGWGLVEGAPAGLDAGWNVANEVLMLQKV